MAKVVIEISDRDDGDVKIEVRPNFATLMAVDISGSKWSPAEVYAIHLLNEAKRWSNEEVGRARKKDSTLWIPKVARAH